MKTSVTENDLAIFEQGYTYTVGYTPSHLSLYKRLDDMRLVKIVSVGMFDKDGQPHQLTFGLTNKGRQLLYRLRETDHLCKHGRAGCSLHPVYTPVTVVDEHLVINDDTDCREWVIAGFSEFAAICPDCQDELSPGDKVRDRMGAGMHLSVNRCWGCSMLSLDGTLVLAPHFCPDCSTIGAGRETMLKTYIKLGLLPLAIERVQALVSATVTERNVSDYIMAGALGDSLNDLDLEELTVG